MQTRYGAALFTAVLALGGCASGRPDITDAEVTQVELAIRSAENATATQHAQELLNRARSALSVAQSERARGKERNAREYLAEAHVAAVAAESKAKSVAAHLQLEAARRDADDLDRRTKELNDSARMP